MDLTLTLLSGHFEDAGLPSWCYMQDLSQAE